MVLSLGLQCTGRCCIHALVDAIQWPLRDVVVTILRLLRSNVVFCHVKRVLFACLCPGMVFTFLHLVMGR